MLAADSRPRMQTKRDPTPSVPCLVAWTVAPTLSCLAKNPRTSLPHVRGRADSSSRRAEVRPHRAGASGRRRPDSIHRLAETISRAAADDRRRAKGWPRRS